MKPIVAIFQEINLSKSIAGYFALYEKSMENLFSKLFVKCDFKEALQTLEHLRDPETSSSFYLEEARRLFIRASYSEKNVRLIFTHIGLAICELHLCEKNNAIIALENALKIKFFPLRIPIGERIPIGGEVFFPIVNHNEVAILDELKDQIIYFLDVGKYPKLDANNDSFDFIETVSGLNLKMVFVEGGTCMMGVTTEQGDFCFDNEKPAHQVTVSNFYIGKYQITQAQWITIMGKIRRIS